MLVTYEGIVIGRRDVGDSGCFLDILTDERGVVEAMAHGVKKLNSAILPSAEMFSYAAFCMSCSGLRYTINSALPKYSFHELGSDIEKLALASYFAQSVKFCTSSELDQLEDGQSSRVRFMAVSLYETLHADGSRRLSSVKSTFELRYSAMLGFMPDLVACGNCGRYESENGMYFLPQKGILLCADCLNPEYEGERVKLLPETLHAMRNSLFAPLERCYKYAIGSEAAKQFSQLSENYFLSRTERSFTALEYYKSLTVN